MREINIIVRVHTCRADSTNSNICEHITLRCASHVVAAAVDLRCHILCALVAGVEAVTGAHTGRDAQQVTHSATEIRHGTYTATYKIRNTPSNR